MGPFKLIKISNSQAPFFTESWELYVSAFPEVERRSYNYFIQTLENQLFHAELIFEDQKFLGLLYWWDLPGFRFIEHYAIIPKKRMHGMGRFILKQFIAHIDTPVFLEVEPEDSEDALRRIRFYQSIGFHFNKHPYFQPTYNPTFKPLKLYLMSYPNELSSNIFADIAATIHHFVY